MEEGEIVLNVDNVTMAWEARKRWWLLILKGNNYVCLGSNWFHCIRIGTFVVKKLYIAVCLEIIVFGMGYGYPFLWLRPPFGTV